MCFLLDNFFLQYFFFCFDVFQYPTKVSSVRAINIPEAPSEVRRIALERHRQGQMSPYICQILRRGEIKLPVLLEDENSPGKNYQVFQQMWP